MSADIQLIVNDASRAALKLHSKITMDLLHSAIINTRPSLSPAELDKYQKIKDQMDGKMPSKQRIGFYK